MTDVNIGIIVGSTRPSRHARAVGPYQHDHTKAWAATIGGYDGFIFVTPEYNHSTSGVLKNAIDYLYAEWNNKAAALVSYGSLGGARAIEHLRGVRRAADRHRAPAAVVLGVHRLRELRRVTPAALHNDAAVTLFDQLESWAGALKALRG